MVVRKWQLFCIFLSFQSITVSSIQCCVGDNTCLEKPIDCPSNVCFKLVFFSTAEERGCMNDLIKYLKFPNSGGGSGDDQCQQLDAQNPGMSLCKCTSNLCNSSTKHFAYLAPVLASILSVVFSFL
ncbi:unnamed protein product [Adineta ricciae]|uniref:Protein quiver n=1 Tax=Adineta ricciae TaxID=249248 RepID=A0A815YBX4_ADIRI|nr:unnamed protein product [Adineta ricciae]